MLSYPRSLAVSFAPYQPNIPELEEFCNSEAVRIAAVSHFYGLLMNIFLTELEASYLLLEPTWTLLLNQTQRSGGKRPLQSQSSRLLGGRLSSAVEHGSVSGSHRGDQRFRLNEANFFALERSRKTSLTIPASGFIEARLVVLFHSGRYLIANPGAGWPAHDLVVVVSITEPQ